MQKLGDYIREVDVRNKDLKVTNLVGLTIEKAFIPSVANIIGTDLSNYKIIRKEQFACSLMQVSRDGKMPIAMFEKDKAIMSPAYPMFEVMDKSKLLPQYLMMWFYRSEFDREASYYAVGGVRGSLTWEDFLNMQLPIPSIEQQREIVSEYETISKRIKLNEQIIKNLEVTAQTLYHKMFVEGIDKEKVSLKDICKIQSGFAFKSEWWQKKGVPVIKINNIHNNTIFRDECDCVSEDKAIIAYKSLVNKGDIVMALTGNVGKISIIPDNGYLVNQRVGIFKVDDVYREFLYLVLNSAEMQNAIQNIGGGSVQINISPIDIGSIKIIMPSACDIRRFHKQVLPVFHTISLKQIENIKLKEIQPLLLAKMGR